MFRNRPWDGRKSSQVSNYIVRGHLCYLRSRIEFAKLRAKEKEKSPKFKEFKRDMATALFKLNFNEICKDLPDWVPYQPEVVESEVVE